MSIQKVSKIDEE
jgi:hypothetical protein